MIITSHLFLTGKHEDSTLCWEEGNVSRIDIVCLTQKTITVKELKQNYSLLKGNIKDKDKIKLKLVSALTAK